MIDANNVSVIYSGDHIDFRKKKWGSTLIDQALLSITSLRKNWSNTVPVFFTHTKPLPHKVSYRFHQLGVETMQNNQFTFSPFPLANKMNFAALPIQSEYLLFLDCDTIIHRPLKVNSTAELLIAYDAIAGLAEDEYRSLFRYLNVAIPDGEFHESPAYEYYYGDPGNIFPAWNSGVFYLRSDLRHDLVSCWALNFRTAYNRFKNASWSFYLEQATFVVSIIAINLNYQILPKGYNYICTPRTNHLKNWHRDKIFVEHYAGDTSRPLALKVPF